MKIQIKSQYFLTREFASFLLGSDVKDVFLANLRNQFEEGHLLEAWERQGELAERYSTDMEFLFMCEDKELEKGSDDYEEELAEYIMKKETSSISH